MFLLVFRSRKRADLDRAAYEAEAERLETLARGREHYYRNNTLFLCPYPRIHNFERGTP